MGKTNNEIPDSIKRLLWEHRDNISLDKHANLIIERTLDHGSQLDIRWLFNQFTQDKIQEVVKKSTNLDPKTASFWALKLGLKEKPKCLQKRSPHKPHKLWKY